MQMVMVLNNQSIKNRDDEIKAEVETFENLRRRTGVGTART